MSSKSQSTEGEGSATVSASQSSLSGGSTAPPSSEIATSEKQSTSTKQSSGSNNPTAAPSVKSSSESSHASSSQPHTENESTTSADALTETQYIISTVTASDSSGLVTFTTTVEAASSSRGSGETTPVEPSHSDTPSSTQGSPIYSPFPSAFIFDAVIAGQSYHLPSSDGPPTVIILHDGKTAELSHDKITIEGESVPVSQLSEDTKIAGVSVQKKPGEADEPQEEEGGGGGGGGGIGGLIGGLVGGAKKAVDGVKEAGESALGVPAAAAAGASTATFAGIAGKLSTAGNGVNALVSGLNGIQKAMPVDKLTQAGLGAAMDAQNLGRQASNWLSSTSGLVKDFPNLPKKVQDQVSDDIKKFAGEGGQLGKAQAALEAFKDFPWESELPQTQLPSATQNPTASATNRPSGTSMPTDTASRSISQDQSTTHSSWESTQSFTSASTTSAQNTTSLQSTQFTSTTSASNTTSATSSTSSAEPSPTETTQYYIRTKEGTSLETFKKFIKELDNAAGRSITYDPKLIPHQGYMTRLTSTQAEGLESKHKFILSAVPIVFKLEDLEISKKEEFRALPQQRNDTDLNLLDALLSEEPGEFFGHSQKVTRDFEEPDNNAPYWKKMLSAPPRTELEHDDPPYKRDKAEGKGATVYIIDDGFDTDQPELQSTADRQVWSHLVPNDFTFPENFLETMKRVHNDVSLKEDVKLGHHGTKMAIVTAGKTLGISPKANLVLFKAKGSWVPSTGAKFQTVSYQYQALDYALDNIRAMIMRKRIDDAERPVDQHERSVVQMSWGLEFGNNRQAESMVPLFDEFFQWCQSMNVPVVLAAGNSNRSPLDKKTPQSSGTTTNTVITVGGVTKRGSLWRDTSPAYNGAAGSMTVFAPAVDIVVPGDASIQDMGTSQAAAIVGGLAAYLYSVVPELKSGENTDMKNFIVQHAWVRAHPEPPVVFGDFARDGWPPRLNVVYNLAAGDPLHQNNPCAPGHIGKRDNSSASACSASYASQSSTPASSINSASSKTIKKSTSHPTITTPATSASHSKNSASSTSDSDFEYSTTTGTWSGKYYTTETKVIVSTVHVTDIMTVAPPPDTTEAPPPPPPPPSSEAPPPAETSHREKPDSLPFCCKRDGNGDLIVGHLQPRCCRRAVGI
ncbi:uncharacterized protein CC84DRAFT_1218950 [Paraphaeosphaeria sporulosa]|uniref:Subtilisin-like protein n=1 Tax=Paraphaeosphaeria sporulosa TaxID=1460663 RepID=A0A177CA57_9PLEO|nr:uncharacterized protein CC84DRAFT_1218950 [Paraphaeosphaeria sporulosa]OAG03658.1 hypothetical protein CC84DRAFT_1218950 [Paraphaeosphaeria sporulosa]